MRSIIKKWLAVFLVAWPIHMAHADRTMPITYSRANIVVLRAVDQQEETPPPLPWQDQEQQPTPASGVVFDVEIRDADAFYAQSGWYNLSAPSEKSGVMLLFQTPGIAPIAPSAQYAPLDILMVDREGIITQIAPSITLASLEEDLMPAGPVKAFLFLRAGICESMGIQPGDRVLYKVFRQPPTVLGIERKPENKALAKPALPVASDAVPTAPLLDTQSPKPRPTGALMVPVP